MIGRDRERHELLERHAVFSINLVQLWRHGRQPQPLLDDRRRHKMSGRNVFLAQTGVTQGLKSPELIERMQPKTFVILRKGVILGDTALANDAGNGLRLRHAFLLHQKFQGAITPTAGWHLEHAGLITFTIDDSPNVQALQQSAPRDAFSQLLDRDASLDAAYVGLAQDQLVEGNVP